VNNAIEIRKVVLNLILGILWICTFLFIKSTLVIDWVGDGSSLTPFKPVVIVIGLLVILFFNLFYRSSPETTKLSWTALLTMAWLALIIFYPFKDPANTAGGAVAFFAMLGGLAVCVFWVRFFSDEIVA